MICNESKLTSSFQPSDTNVSATPATSQQRQAMRVAMWTSVATTRECVAAVAAATRLAPTNASANPDSQSQLAVTVQISTSVPTKAFARLVLVFLVLCSVCPIDF